MQYMPNQRDEPQRPNLATFLGGANTKKKSVISKASQGFQDLDEDEFAEKEQAKKAHANELFAQMEEKRRKKEEDKKMEREKEAQDEERVKRQLEDSLRKE